MGILTRHRDFFCVRVYEHLNASIGAFVYPYIKPCPVISVHMRCSIRLSYFFSEPFGVYMTYRSLTPQPIVNSHHFNYTLRMFRKRSRFRSLFLTL